MWALGSKPRAPHWEVFCGRFLLFWPIGLPAPSRAGHFSVPMRARVLNVSENGEIQSVHSLDWFIWRCSIWLLPSFWPSGSQTFSPPKWPKTVL